MDEKPLKKGEKKDNFRDERGRFLPGKPPGPGRPKGTKNFSTLFEEAIKKIVKSEKLPIKDVEVELVVKAIIEALKGNYPFWRDLMDRVYGKPKITVESIEDKEKVEALKELTEAIKKIAERK